MKKLLFIFIFVCSELLAQDHGFFNQVWLEQGLSQSSIISILQDKQGFMWFATQDGLNRYDGRNMDHFNFRPFNKHSISGDDIYAICANDNTLFVLNDKGLDKIDLNELKITNLRSTNPPKNGNIFYRCWFFHNTLYMLSREGLARTAFTGESEYNSQYLNFNKEENEANPLIVSLCANKEKIFAATSNGIYEMSIGKNEFVRTDIGYKIDFPVNAIAVSGNRLYFTGNKMAFSYDLATKKMAQAPLSSNAEFNSILIDNQNKIWLGSSTRGLMVLSQKNNDSLVVEKTFVRGNNRYSLQTNEITSLYQNAGSGSGVVWIGSRDAGAFSYNYSKNSFSIPTNNLPLNDPNFFGIVKDKEGIIWTGSNTGILMIDRKNKSSHFIELGENVRRVGRPIEALCDDGENIWAGYGNILFQVDKKSKQLLVKANPIVPGRNNQISKVIATSKEQLLLCASRGLIIYNKNSGTEKIISSVEVGGKNITIENVSSYLADPSGDQWIGCSAGLLCLKKNGPNIHIQHNNKDSGSILSNRIMDIKRMNDGRLLLATTKGLSIIQDEGKKIRNIYSAPNLVNNFIYGLLEDGSGRFWMSTNFGISVFDPRTRRFKSYTASDGICFNEFNSGGYYRSEDGELLFGGLGGLVSINPGKQMINTSVSDIVLRGTRIENFDGKVSSGDKISLSYWQNDLQFEFSVPDYSGQKNISLYYRFLNKDTNLTKVNSSQLFSLNFVNIAPGKYDLEVIAVNNEGARSKPFNVRFVIGDPFWSTWWFYLILIFITVITSWLIYRARLKRKIEYIQQIEQVRKEESEKVRKAAALDLHDEFGNGLTRISMLIEMIKLQISGENQEARKLLDVISQNSGRLYLGTKDFIWSINPGKDNMYEIIIRIKDYADEIFYGTNITFELTGLQESLREIRQTPTAGRNIAMIFKESLSNVLKHAKASKVKLGIESNNGTVKLCLEDNGTGFEMKDNKNSFGLTNIQQRAARSEAKLQVESSPGKGTKIVLTIIKNNHDHDNNA